MEISTNAQSKKVFGLDLHSFEFIPNSCRIDQIQKEEGWILFSLGMRSLNGKGIVHQRPSDELFNDDDDVPSRDKKYPNQFSCAVCRDTFVSNFQAQKFLPLPSDYWYEMTECWACHHEDYTTLPGQVGGQVFAQKNVLLAGISYYLLHPTHLDLDKIHIRLTGRESRFKSNRWVEVCCKRCRSTLGEGFVNRSQQDLSTDTQGITTFKLYKSKISATVIDSTTTLERKIPTKSWTHYFVRELIETANAHANYRFILLDEETLGPIIALWVLNWKCQEGVVGKDGNIHFKPAVKILYKRISQSNNHDAEFIEKWQSDRMVEQFPHNHESLVELIITLQKSTLSMPPSKRFFNGFQVALLFY